MSALEALPPYLYKRLVQPNTGTANRKMETSDFYIGLAYLVTLMMFAAIAAARRDTRVHVEKKIPFETTTEETLNARRPYRQSH